MATRLDDRWLWLGVGICTILAITGIRYAITDIAQLTRIDPSEESTPTGATGDHPEDGIPLDSLKTLCDSPNSDIANSARAIVVSRAYRHPKTMAAIRKDLHSNNKETRHRATRALGFMRELGMPMDAQVLDYFDRRRHVMPARVYDVAGPSGSASEPQTLVHDIRDLTTRATRVPEHILDNADAIVPSIENPVAGWTSVPRERSSTINGSEHEADARRRRREAIVVAEYSSSPWRNQ